MTGKVPQIARRAPGPILIIDDEPDVRSVLKAQLESMGYTVDEAPDAETGFAMARSGRYTLAFLDIMMPGIDGIEAARKIRQVAPNTRQVFITASTDNETFQRAVSSDSFTDGFLNKPLTLAEVARCVEVVLEKKGKFLHVL